MPAIERFSPFRDLDLMERRMRRIFSDLSFPFVPTLAPAADVYETDGELVVELEVPGYGEKDLDVEVVDHTLVVKGERQEVTETKEKALRLHERLESKFERRFELPVETESEHLSASYGKGVLTLHVPKRAQVKPRTIEIVKESVTRALRRAGAPAAAPRRLHLGPPTGSPGGARESRRAYKDQSGPPADQAA